MNKPEFQFGDLVHVSGYEPQVFSIDGFREEIYHYPDENWTDLVYELHDVGTGEWIEADAQDLSLVAPVDQADEYLSANPAPVTPKITLIFGMEATEVKKPERKPTARELSGKEAEERKKARKERAEQINNLLDMRNWNSEMLVKTGNEEFGDWVFAIDCELKRLTESE